jgi:hypothetical protein
MEAIDSVEHRAAPGEHGPEGTVGEIHHHQTLHIVGNVEPAPVRAFDQPLRAVEPARRGSEFALIAASRYPWIRAVVAYTPSDLVWEGWGLEMLEAEGTRSSFSFGGHPLPFMPYRGFVAGLQAGAAADLRAIHENGRADHPEREAAARIPVEAYRGALMLVAGDRDALWNSGRMARSIVAARRAAGLETDALLYPEAGHDLGGGSAEPREGPGGRVAQGDGVPGADADALAQRGGRSRRIGVGRCVPSPWAAPLAP